MSDRRYARQDPLFSRASTICGFGIVESVDLLRVVSITADQMRPKKGERNDEKWFEKE